MRKVRYLSKNYNANERNNFSLWWKEQIEHYGVKVNYYTNGYTLTSQDFMYGEDPTSNFLSAGEVIMVTSITNDSILLSKFGVMADCDMTAMIHISRNIRPRKWTKVRRFNRNDRIWRIWR